MRLKSAGDSKPILQAPFLLLIPAAEPSPQQPDLLVQSTQSMPKLGALSAVENVVESSKDLLFFEHLGEKLLERTESA